MNCSGTNSGTAENAVSDVMVALCRDLDYVWVVNLLNGAVEQILGHRAGLAADVPLDSNEKIIAFLEKLTTAESRGILRGETGIDNVRKILQKVDFFRTVSFRYRDFEDASFCIKYVRYSEDKVICAVERHLAYQQDIPDEIRELMIPEMMETDAGTVFIRRSDTEE